MDSKERFLSKIRVEGEHWIWCGGCSTGYGQFWDSDKRRIVYAHRYAYEVFVGPIPEGVMVLHRHEGMKLCVCPQHLKLGDRVENAEDCGYKLTVDKIREIRNSDLSIRKLAAKCGVSASAVLAVKRGTLRKSVIEKENL